MAIIDKIIANYSFENNAANTTVTDSCGAYAGTASTNTNGMSTGGKNSLGFDFTSDKITCGDNFDFGASDFSFNFWINPDSLSSNPVFIWKGNYSSNGYYLGIDGGYLDFVWRDSGAKRQTSVERLSTGSWQMVTITRSGTNIKLYINGTECTYSTTGSCGTIANAATNFTIGAYDTTSYYDGKADEFMIFDEALTTDDITSLYNSGTGIFYPFSIVPTDVTITPDCFIITASTNPIDITIRNFKSGTIVVGTGTIGTRFLDKNYPYEEGLIAGTTRQS